MVGWCITWCGRISIIRWYNPTQDNEDTPVRYVENVLMYDLIWNVIALAMVVGGIVILMRTRSPEKEFLK